MIGLDANILMHPKVRETSGHVDNFDDPLIDDKNTGERFRADKIIEDSIESMKNEKTEEVFLQLENLYRFKSAINTDLERRSLELKE